MRLPMLGTAWLTAKILSRRVIESTCQASAPRDVLPPTPPGPEGSNGNGLLRVQWAAGAWLFLLLGLHRGVARVDIAFRVRHNTLSHSQLENLSSEPTRARQDQRSWNLRTTSPVDQCR